VITSIQNGPALAAKEGVEYFLSPDAVFIMVEDGSARLLDMAGRFYAMPTVGARMLKETLANGADAATMQVSKDYGAPLQQVRADLDVFLSELQKQGLLFSQRNRQRRRKAALVLARLLLRPSLGATHRLLRSPVSKARALLALARLSFAFFGWTPTVAVWKEAHAHFPAQSPSEQDAQTLAALDSAICAAAASHPVPVACKERGFCSWALARAAGFSASIVVGVFLFPMAGHCWCEAGTQMLGDDHERCREFTPVGRW
jgi:hypothetical protein